MPEVMADRTQSLTVSRIKTKTGMILPRFDVVRVKMHRQPAVIALSTLLSAALLTLKSSVCEDSTPP